MCFLISVFCTNRFFLQSTAQSFQFYDYKLLIKKQQQQKTSLKFNLPPSQRSYLLHHIVLKVYRLFISKFTSLDVYPGTSLATLSQLIGWETPIREQRIISKTIWLLSYGKLLFSEKPRLIFRCLHLEEKMLSNLIATNTKG